jgi:hypothetical protein
VVLQEHAVRIGLRLHDLVHALTELRELLREKIGPHTLMPDDSARASAVNAAARFNVLAISVPLSATQA